MSTLALDQAGEAGFESVTRLGIPPTTTLNTEIPNLEIVASLHGFEALEEEWTALYERAGHRGNPFQSFAWCWHWVNNFIGSDGAGENSRSLYVLTGRTKGRLTMVWPMVRECKAGLKTLTWLGAPVTQYGDVLIEEENALPRLRQAWQHLRENAAADAITLFKVREDAAIAPLMTEIGAVVTHKDLAPYADMSQSDTFETYAAQRYSKKRKSYIRRYRKRFEEIAPLRFDTLTAGDEARAITNELLECKHEWLKAKSMVSRALSDPRTNAFFLDTVTDTERSTGCRITTLHCGEELVGANLNYVAKGHAVAHVITYNLSYEKWSPGHLTIYEDLKNMKDDGINVFDLMGPSSKFKLDWADNCVEVNDWAVPLSVKGTVWTRFYLGFARDRLKAAHKALPPSVKRLTSPLMSAILMVG